MLIVPLITFAASSIELLISEPRCHIMVFNFFDSLQKECIKILACREVTLPGCILQEIHVIGLLNCVLPLLVFI